MKCMWMIRCESVINNDIVCSEMNLFRNYLLL